MLPKIWRTRSHYRHSRVITKSSVKSDEREFDRRTLLFGALFIPLSLLPRLIPLPRAMTDVKRECTRRVINPIDRSSVAVVQPSVRSFIHSFACTFTEKRARTRALLLSQPEIPGRIKSDLDAFARVARVA